MIVCVYVRIVIINHQADDEKKYHALFDYH